MLTVTETERGVEGRFSRFELISWWDQARLRRARVLVAGAGALGNELVKNCALVGIGNLLVADMDRIENSNLSRSVLFRERDNGRLKAEVACDAARSIYPDIRAQPFAGNVVHDLGLGVYLWADVVLGAFDNREARVAINAGAAFARKPWIDGAIEVLDGVARVFDPQKGPCYDGTMSEVDWKILESRRSCALLTRDEMEQGRVPTTPTTASVIAAVQVQELVKCLHGLETMAGHGFVYSGLTSDAYRVTYPRKPDCFGHDTYERLVPLGAGTGEVTVGALRRRAAQELGGEPVLQLSRDIIASLRCPGCGAEEPVFKRLGQVSERAARCGACGETRVPETKLSLTPEDALEARTFESLAVPRMDVVTARSGDRSISYLFDGDAGTVLGPLSRDSLIGGS